MTVRGVDIIDKLVWRDAPPFTNPRTTRAFVFARGVIFGEVIGAPKSRPMSFLGARSLFQDTADRFVNASELTEPRSIALVNVWMSSKELWPFVGLAIEKP